VQTAWQGGPCGPPSRWEKHAGLLRAGEEKHAEQTHQGRRRKILLAKSLHTYAGPAARGEPARARTLREATSREGQSDLVAGLVAGLGRQAGINGCRHGAAVWAG